jgi:hypothetical protein
MLYARNDRGDLVSFKGRVFQLLQAVLGLLRASLAVGTTRNQIIDALRLLHPKASPFALTRIGGGGDGSYLSPDDFEGVIACFSPGVSGSADFELGLADRGIRSYLADYSVNGPPELSPLFDFEKLFIATYNESEKFIRLDDWIDKKVTDAGDLVLQMDIEGAEWPILSDISPETLSRFRIVILELHSLDYFLTNPQGLEIFESVFKKLNTQFSVVHLHANNFGGELNYQGIKIPRVIEVTLVRNDRYQKSNRVFNCEIPHPLDVANFPGKKELHLSKDWVG